MKRFLPYVVDTVTVLVGVVCLAILIPILLGNNRLPGPDLGGEVIGQRLDVSGVDFSAQSETLIMVLASDCVFCQESMPFYRRLLAAERGDVRIVVAASPVDTVIESYLTAEGVNPDSVVFVASPLPVRGTPALLLTDREGVVTHAWVGLLDAGRESEVLSEIAPAGVGTSGSGALNHGPLNMAHRARQRSPGLRFGTPKEPERGGLQGSAGWRT